MIAGWLVWSTGRPTSGLVATILFFYQVAPLVKGSSWQRVSPAVMGVLQAIFAFAPPDVDWMTDSSSSSSSSSSNSGGAARGICVIEEMTAVQKIAARVLFQAIVLGCIFVVFVMHGGGHRLMPSRIKAPESWMGTYMAVITRLLTIAYITLVLVPLQLVQCVWMDGDHVWWWDAEVHCYETGWQVGAFVAIGVLSPLPAVLMWMTSRRVLIGRGPSRDRHREGSNSHSHSSIRLTSATGQGDTKLLNNRASDNWELSPMAAISPSSASSPLTAATTATTATATSSGGANKVAMWRIAADKQLCTGFREERRWWLGMSMYRRLIVVIVYTTITDQVWRSLTMTSVCCVFVAMNLGLRPFANRMTHWVETVSLVVLCALSATAAPQLARAEFGSGLAISREGGLEALQIVLIMIPGAMWVGVSIGQKIMMILQERKLSKLDAASRNEPSLEKVHGTGYGPPAALPALPNNATGAGDDNTTAEMVVMSPLAKEGHGVGEWEAVVLSNLSSKSFGEMY